VSLVLADTSAWIEYLRGADGKTRTAVRERVPRRQAALTEPILMELLAGALDERRASGVASMLGSFPLKPVDATFDYTAAAQIYRVCRHAGLTLRNQIDCLIAAVAIRTGLPLLHRDADFDFIAHHTPLQIYEPT
jgi:predicted nucleic acid-binding protein